MIKLEEPEKIQHNKKHTLNKKKLPKKWKRSIIYKKGNFFRIINFAFVSVFVFSWFIKTVRKMKWRRKKYEIIRKLHEKKSVQELEYYGTNKKQEWKKE